MASLVKPIPDGFRTVTPHLCIKGASDAIDFYKRAFGAEEILRMPGPDGKSVMHAEIKIGDCLIMLADEFPGMSVRSPKSLGGVTATLHIYVPDADAAYNRAIAAGATASMPLMDAFWGDRYGRVTDPYGHEWAIATHTKDLTPEQIAKGAHEWASKMPQKK